jgi:hypothetical protein
MASASPEGKRSELSGVNDRTVRLAERILTPTLQSAALRKSHWLRIGAPAGRSKDSEFRQRGEVASGEPEHEIEAGGGQDKKETNFNKIMMVVSHIPRPRLRRLVSASNGLGSDTDNLRDLPGTDYLCFSERSRGWWYGLEAGMWILSCQVMAGQRQPLLTPRLRLLPGRRRWKGWP